MGTPFVNPNDRIISIDVHGCDWVSDGITTVRSEFLIGPEFGMGPYKDAFPNLGEMVDGWAKMAKPAMSGYQETLSIWKYHEHTFKTKMVEIFTDSDVVKIPLPASTFFAELGAPYLVTTERGERVVLFINMNEDRAVGWIRSVKVATREDHE